MQVEWQPTASMTVLKQRAAILAKIRAFFAEREVMEVETPSLSQATVTDVHIASIGCQLTTNSKPQQTYYLQTSPEYAMKRLLAAGSGSIYQICKAFRAEEVGAQHNPEFTMLEWYRVDFDHHDLMAEMDALLQLVLDCGPADKFSYAELFQQYLAINPHTANIEELQTLLSSKDVVLSEAFLSDNRDAYLQLLMSHCIEPQLGMTRPVFVYDYPQTQAALARIRHDDIPVAERFEVYLQGVELANGFHELADANEQRQRFLNDSAEREKLGLPAVPIAEHLLAALENGLPDCAGVALGIDRLVMLACAATSIQDVIAMPIDRS